MQTVSAGDRSSWKDFTIAVDHEVFGVDRDQLRSVLSAEGIDTRTYFDPPVHRQSAYRHVPSRELPVTDDVSRRVVSLPVYPALPGAAVDGIVRVIAAAHDKSTALSGLRR